jgi:hypothetical protein
LRLKGCVQKTQSFFYYFIFIKLCSVKNLGLSFLQKQESIVCTGFWIPAFAGMTDKSVSFQQSNKTTITVLLGEPSLRCEIAPAPNCGSGLFRAGQAAIISPDWETNRGFPFAFGIYTTQSTKTGL